MVEVVVVAWAWEDMPVEKVMGGAGHKMEQHKREVGREDEESIRDRAVTASEQGTSGKVLYGEPLGIELHSIVVVTSEAANREKGMNQMGAIMTSLT
jgi:hypothetical protein